MSKPNRPQTPAAPAQKTAAQPPIQRKHAPPVAPPVYRPQPTPKVLQRKTAVTQRPSSQPPQPRPAAPAAYRPQPTPKVLQRKTAVGQTPPSAQSGNRPAAPPVYRPQPAAKVLQQSRLPRVNPAPSRPAAAIQLLPMPYVKAAASGGQHVTWDPETQQGFAEIEQYAQGAYARSDRREIKRLRTELAKTQANAKNQAPVQRLAQLLDGYINQLKAEKQQLKLQIEAIPADSKNKANRANVTAFADGQCIYTGPPNNYGTHYLYRSGTSQTAKQEQKSNSNTSSETTSSNRVPSGSSPQDLDVIVSAQDSEIRLLDDLENFLLGNQQEHKSKFYSTLLIQIYTVLGSCDTCKRRIRLMAQRMADTGWQKVTVKIVYEVQQTDAPRNDRSTNKSVKTNYGNKADPNLIWKNELKYRKGAPKPRVSCEAFAPTNASQMINSNTTTTTMPQQVVISNNNTNNAPQQTQGFQATDPAWLLETFNAYRNNLMRLEELAYMIINDAIPELRPLHKSYLKKIHTRIIELIEEFGLDVKEFEILKEIERF